MDYNQIIEEIFKNNACIIIEKFKEDNMLGRSFNRSIDSIITSIADRKNSSIINKNHNLFNNSIYYLKHRHDYYRKDVPIKNLIEVEIRTEFEDKIKKRKIIDLDNNEFEYSFNEFIYDLITYVTLGNVENRLRDNSELYKLLYENNNYKDFTLEAFEGHVVNTLLYKKLFAKFSPGKPVPSAIEKESQLGGKIYEITYQNTATKKNTKPSKEVTISVPEFDDEEKCLILNICLVEKSNIPLTEKIKLIILMGGFDDYTIFQKTSNNSVIYNKINKGVDRKGSSQTMIKLINRLINKIEPYNLTFALDTLRHIRDTKLKPSKTKQI